MALRIKFLSKNPGVDTTLYWQRFLPHASPLVGNCQFIFNRDSKDYDWLVVMDDLPSVANERFTLWRERLACHPDNTLFFTLEPSTIKTYGNGFLAQFGHVLSSQEKFAIQHRNHLCRQCGLPWFYGKTYEEARNLPSAKNKMLSTVCSSKRQKHTLHHLRYSLTQILKKEIPDMEVFGHGHREIEIKALALDAYEYHLAIENHLAPHHWTEKLADAFLGGCFPIYFGAPNVYDYFPEESLALVDIRNQAEAIDEIQQLVHSDKAKKSRPAIKEARRLVLEEYALFPMLARTIEELHQTRTVPPNSEREILSRHAWRRAHPAQSILFPFERLSNRYLGKRAAEKIVFK